MEVADKVVRYFSSSPNRQLSLEKWIQDTLPEEKRKILKQLCHTRWVERHEAFRVFSDLFSYSLLSGINFKEHAMEQRSDARSLLLALSQFQFLVTLEATKNVLEYTRALSVKLQGQLQTLHGHIRTWKLSKITCKVFALMWKYFMTKFTRLAQAVNVEESVPRIASRQEHRSNVTAGNYKEHYRRNLTIPLLD